MKSLIQRFEDAVKATGYRTCSDATQQEYEAAKKSLQAALDAAPASAEEPSRLSLLDERDRLLTANEGMRKALEGAEEPVTFGCGIDRSEGA